MKGLHLTADLYCCRCDGAWLTDAPKLGEWCLSAIAAAGLQPVGRLFEAVPAAGDGPAGVTATVLLAGSHVCLHTSPGEKAVTCDVYLGDCDGDRPDRARALMEALVDRFLPEWTEQRSLDRGDGQ